ncbi:hypothetical protein D3C86_1190230 [compost metagenome]
MNDQVVFLLCIENYQGFRIVVNTSGITNLSTTFRIERCFGKYQLVECFLFLGNFAVFHDFNSCFQIIVPNKFFHRIIDQLNPIICFNSRSNSGTVFLFGQFLVEPGLVYRKIILTSDQAR